MLSSELRHATLSGLLRRKAAERPERDAFIFLADGEDEGARLTWAELDGRARAIACALRASLAPGDRALLLYPPGLEFIAAFFGCLHAGVVAVPAYPPRPNDRNERAQTRLRAIARDAEPRAALTTSAILAGVEAAAGPSRPAAAELAALRWIATDELPLHPPTDIELPEPDPESVAFLQYTSGSTATPKGVMVTHANLLHNERMIGEAFAMDEDSVVVGWLPLYHDMGLIGNVLQPLHSGARCVLMSPVAFLQRPLRWLAAISHYRATTSGGPNFAYDLCVRRIGPEERADLDLSSWRVAFNGAEPVRAETLERFAAAFAPCGFRREAFYPCYGLAEATLFVSGGAPGRPPRTADIEDRSLVSCGHAWGGQRIAIVDPEAGVELAPGRTGEIWIAGPSVARGYWRNPEATQRDFQARLAGTGMRFLRTGDLGALRDGELYVTGRIKDLIILRGRNHYPQDLELTAERSHPDLRPGCGAAFAVEAGTEERLVVVQEVERHRRPGSKMGSTFEELTAAIRRAIAEEHEVQAHEVVLVRAGTVPKTSSGKIQRRLCRELYLTGELAVLERSAVSASTDAGEGLALTRDDLAVLDPAERAAALERFLRERAAAALGISPGAIDPQQPLTAHGLDSLAAIELKGAVEAALGVELPLAELLEGAGTARLAEVLARTGTDQHGPTRTEQGSSCSTSLSYGERALWFLHRLAPEAGAYNIAVAARARGLDLEGLRRALEAAAGRHAALRTVFPAEDGQPRRQVLERPEIDWREEEAAGWSEAELQERLAAEAWRPFSLEEGPLVRVRLFHRGPEEPVLLFAVHHIVADFASLAIVVRELGADLPPHPHSPADFAAQQEAVLAGPRGERLWDYWRATLAGLPDLDLPADRPRPPAQTWRGVARFLELPPGLTGRVRALAAEHGATLYTVLLAAFAAQLGRTSGQRDFAVGAPAAGRGAPEWAGAVAYFVNPVALRADLDGDPAFSGFLGRMRRTVLDGLAHGDFPFPLLAERLRPARDPARAPLFQAMFLLQKARPGDPPELGVFALGESGGRLSIGNAELESLRIEERRTQVDLTLRAAELPSGGLGLSLEVNADLFDATTAERMLGHLQTLLAAAVTDPDRPLAELPWLTPAERRQVLTEWSTAPAAPPQDRLLHQPFEEQAARTPHAEALVAGTDRLTYEELNRRANQLAHHLRGLGVGPEVRVGVRLGRSADLVVSLLAVLKAGGAYVPLDPAYPEERLALMLEDSGARVVMTRSGVEVRHRTDPTDLTDRTDHPSDRSYPSARSESPPPTALPGNLAYLIYTSGSTGRPKAVAIEHRSATALVQWARGVFPPADLAGVLAATSIAFDLSVFELFVPLSSGGRVILAENALELPRLPAASEVTLVNTVPSAMAELVRGGLPRSIRTVNLAGEPIPPALVEAVYGVPGIERLYNLYGPSEDTTYSTFTLLAAGRGVTIGRPIDGTRAYVLDARLEPLPAGVPGELFLGGAGLARGYLGRPELTAERFIPDRFGGGPGARLYRTGDLARWRPDGALDFLGRTDHQVKVRGFRIELGEIEAALTRLPGLRDATVLALDDRGFGRRLVAFVVAETGAEPRAAELRAGLRRTLPEHMIPAAFVPLPKLPLSPNGKVNRRELERLGSGITEETDGEPRTAVEARLCELFAEMAGAPRAGIHQSFFDLGGHSLLATRLVARIEREFGVDLPVSALFETPTVARLAARLDQGTTLEAAAPATPRRRERSMREQQPYEPPRTPLEERLVALWASVLGREQVGIHDDFFDLGGHSLLGARLLLEARHWFGVDLPLADLFDARTPAALAERLEASGARLAPVTAEWPEPPAGARIAPLSFAQQRLWLLHQLDPESAAYHVPGVLTLAGTLRPEVLAAALEEIVRRHDALRTVFAVTREEPVQAVLPPAPRVLPLVDLTGLPDSLRASEAVRLAAAEARRPFDLAAGPLLRTLLLRTAAAEHRLVLVMHHIISDGWSLGVLRAELAALVAAFAEGRPAPLPPLPLQVPDFAEAQRRDLREDVLERQLAHWRTRLDGAPALELPADKPRPAVLSDRGAAVPVTIPSDVAQGLRELARAEGATLFMALLAAWSALLARSSGQDDLTVGTPVAGRDRPEMESLIGCFVNTLPLRVRMEDDPPFRALLRQVREVTLAAYDHQSVPFEKLVEDLAPARDRGRTPLFQTMLALHNAPQPPLALPGLELSLDEIPTGTAKLDLSLLLTDGTDGLTGTLEYRTDLFEEATAERLAAHLQELLAGAVRAPDERLPDFRVPRGPRREDAALPLSFAQERLWILDRLQEGSAAYNMPFQVRLRGAAPGVPELAAALAGVVRRHETLRTRFSQGTAGHPVQVIEPPPASWPLPLVDLAGLSDTGREGEARRLAEAEARRPFRLDAGPVLRTALLRLASDEHLLLLNLHHIATDGWSMGLLLAELQELYGALRRGDRPRLPELPIQYADFAVWQRSRLDGEILEREVAWWRERLRGLPALDLPTDRPRPAVPSHRGGEVAVVLGPELSWEITALAREAGATPFMVLLAGWSALLAGWSGQHDLAVGGPVAGRTRKETESLIGFFVNSLVLRCNVAGTPDFSTLLERARRTVLDAHAHQELPFEKLVDALQPRRDLARAPLFQVMLALQAFPLPALELDGVTLDPEPVPTGTAKVDLTLYLRETGKGFAGTLEYAADLFDRATAERLAGGLRALLAAAVADPGLSLAELMQRTSLPLAAQRRIMAAPSPLPASDAPYVPPRTDLERTLCAAWAEILGLERVGVRESFFDIGGNSLAMVRLRSHLAEILGREVSVATLFSHPTIESLAKELAVEAPQPAAEAAGDARERTELRRTSLRQLQQARGSLRARKP